MSLQNSYDERDKQKFDIHTKISHMLQNYRKYKVYEMIAKHKEELLEKTGSGGMYKPRQKEQNKQIKAHNLDAKLKKMGI